MLESSSHHLGIGNWKKEGKQRDSKGTLLDDLTCFQKHSQKFHIKLPIAPHWAEHHMNVFSCKWCWEFQYFFSMAIRSTKMQDFIVIDEEENRYSGRQLANFVTIGNKIMLLQCYLIVFWLLVIWSIFFVFGKHLNFFCWNTCFGYLLFFGKEHEIILWTKQQLDNKTGYKRWKHRCRTDGKYWIHLKIEQGLNFWEYACS